MAKTILHAAETRGHAQHGWLNTYHTFSFANYQNRDRMHFGVLRVLNDDTVAPKMGFGMHPHDNMEIITIPLKGELKHEDSMGNGSVIRYGDVQVMSAGTGIMHSEFNNSNHENVELLQIWVFPKQKEVPPRYDQISLTIADQRNQLQQILSPNANDAGVWIHQDAWFYVGLFDNDFSTDYTIKQPGNGVYLFIIEGGANIEEQVLNKRDGIGIWDTQHISITATSPNTQILVMDIPMTI